MSQSDDRPAPRPGGYDDAPTQALPTTGPSARTEAATSAFGRGSGARAGLPGDALAGPPGGGAPGLGMPGPDRRPPVPRPAMSRSEPRTSAARGPVRARRAKLALRRIDPWSVFLFSLLASIFLGIVLVVAVTVLYAVLANLGVLDSVNDLFGEVAGDGAGGAAGSSELITSSRVLSGAAVLAAVDIVLLTALATLGALLYNLCAALTGGIEVTLGERD